MLCAICLLFSPRSTILLILLPGPGQDPKWSFNLVFFKTNGSGEDPLYTRYHRNSSNHGKGMALFTVHQDMPTQKDCNLFSTVLFLWEAESIFWLFGVLVKLSFPSCIAGHMSHLFSLNEFYLQKLAVGLIYIYIKYNFLRPSVYEVSPPYFQPVVEKSPRTNAITSTCSQTDRW